MRTDVNVAGQAVLAVVLSDVESSLQFSIPKIRDAILKGGFGHTRVTKDFLLPDSRAKIVHRDCESRRRKCDALYLEKLEKDSVLQLKAGNATDQSVNLTCVTCYFHVTQQQPRCKERKVEQKVCVKL